MPKRFIRRITPDHRKIREHPHLQVFGTRLHDPSIWHLNRRSASGAFGVGLFMAFVPVPFQMVLAAAAAIVLRVNLPLSVVLVWVTNPLTIPPMFYFAYRIGAWLLGVAPVHLEFELSLDYLLTELGTIWRPLLLGSLLCGSVLGVAGYGVIRGLWRWHILCELKLRRAKRETRETQRRSVAVAQSEQSTPS